MHTLLSGSHEGLRIHGKLISKQYGNHLTALQAAERSLDVAMTWVHTYAELSLSRTPGGWCPNWFYASSKRWTGDNGKAVRIVQYI